MKIVSLIPARGGSKGIPLKNIINLDGRPLISYAIMESLNSNVDETWVSTDSVEIADVSEKYGAKVLMRPSHLADNIIIPDPALVHFSKNQTFDILVFIQPTSPFIKPKYINHGLKKMYENKYDAMVSVTKEHWLPRWNEEVKPIDWDVNNNQILSEPTIAQQKLAGTFTRKHVVFFHKNNLRSRSHA